MIKGHKQIIHRIKKSRKQGELFNRPNNQKISKCFIAYWVDTDVYKLINIASVGKHTGKQALSCSVNEKVN